MGRTDIETQPGAFKAKRVSRLKSKRYGKATQSTKDPSFHTNSSQENATPLFEISNRRNIPTTKLDEASKTSYTKNLEKLRRRALKQL